MSKEEEIILTQSPNDSNKYRYIKLKNDLEVVLVSDEKTDQASCVLTLCVGSLSDTIPGLAHFLEHMLFLGTEKFPVENEFQSFISRNGGSYNGTTGGSRTNYYFTVNQESLKEAIDRFSSFFISPLMNKDSVDRELSAVDSEHSGNIKKDPWRINRIINDQFEGHPISSFSTGNSSTLRRDDIRDRVVEFYNQNYSSNVMKVCIYGRESLDQLEEWAKEFFGPIVNKNVKAPSPPPYGIKKSIMLEVEPSAEEQDLLKLLFPVDDEKLCFTKNYKNASCSILACIIGHESKGSLLSVLIAKNYAYGLSCGNDSTYETMNKIEVTIYLTKLGLENIDEIMALVFQYTQCEVPEYCFTEKKELTNINWSCFQKSSSINVAKSITHNLFLVKDPRDTLKFNHFTEKFDPEEIDKIKSWIRPDNMIAMVYSSKFKGQTTETEQYYGIKYNKKFIEQQQIDKWLTGYPKNQDIFVPKPNPFIPKDISIKSTQDGSIEVPTKIYSENGVEVYHAMDHRFNTPKARLNIRFDTQFHGNNQSMVMWNLLIKSMKEVLNENIYYCKTLGYTFKTSILTNHVERTSYGFSDKIFDTAYYVLDYLHNIDLTDDQFKRTKEKVSKRFINTHNLAPYTTALRTSTLYSQNCNSDLLEKQQYLPTVTKENFINYFKNVFSYINYTVMVVGNVTAEDAIAFGKKLNTYNRVAACPSDIFKLSRVNLPQGVISVVREHLVGHGQQNCASAISFATGALDKKKLAIATVLNPLLHSCYFEELRTKNQFGYVVQSFIDQHGGSLHIRFIVQSHTKTPQQIFDATFAFLEDFEKDLEAFESKPEEFKKFIEQCQHREIVKQPNNTSQSTIYWSHLCVYNQFEYEKKKFEEIGKLTLTDLQDFYKQYLSPNSKDIRVLVSQCFPESVEFSNTTTPEEEAKNIQIIKKGDYVEFRKRYGFLPTTVNY